MAGTKNLNPFGKGEGGRPKGAVNKSTRERNAMIREMILNSSVIGNALELLQHRILNEPETVRTADAIKAFAILVPYIAQTTDQEQLIETAETSMSRDEILKSITDRVPALKVVK